MNELCRNEMAYYGKKLQKIWKRKATLSCIDSDLFAINYVNPFSVHFFPFNLEKYFEKDFN